MTRILQKIISHSIQTLDKNEIIPPTVTKIINVSSRYFLLLVALLLILQQLGLSVSAIWATVSATIAMVAVGFVAVWSVISNVLCTFILLASKPFRIGDTITLVDTNSPDIGVKGQVANISLIFTTLIDKNQHIKIPNNMMFQKIIKRVNGTITFELEEQLFQDKSLLQKIRPMQKNKQIK
jgi:small-conductance mechanosensitive channel